MYEEQRIDTSDIDRLMEKKRNDALQQLYQEIVNQVEIRVSTGQISSNKQSNGNVTEYVSFNVGHMPSFRKVFPFGKGVHICDSVSPTFNRQTQEAISQLKQLCVNKKIEINTTYAANEMMARYYIATGGIIYG